MRRTSRLLLAAVSILAVLPQIAYLLILLDRGKIAERFAAFLETPPAGMKQVLLVALTLLLILACLASFAYSILGARMRKTRSKSTDVGMIDIGVNALENIALNAAKAAQAGIKTAKARVYAAKNDEISIELSVVLYSDVEIPLQMAKIQERVKKDVEKYTGIGVCDVRVKVTRVELIGARVER